MGLVDDHAAVAFEGPVALDLVEQQTVGHHLDHGPGGRLVGETHRVAHLRA